MPRQPVRPSERFSANLFVHISAACHSVFFFEIHFHRRNIVALQNLVSINQQFRCIFELPSCIRSSVAVDGSNESSSLQGGKFRLIHMKLSHSCGCACAHVERNAITCHSPRRVYCLMAVAEVRLCCRCRGCPCHTTVPHQHHQPRTNTLSIPNPWQ